MSDHTLLWALAGQLAWLVPAGLLGGAIAAAVGQPRLVGGLLIGLLLSPAVLGRIAPAVDTRLRHANVTEQLELETYTAKRDQLRLDLLSTGITPVAVDQFDEMTNEQVATMRQAVDDKAAQQHEARQVLMLGVGGLFVLVGGFLLNDRKWVSFVPDALGVAGGALVGVAALGAAALWLLGRWPSDQPGLLAGLGWGAAAVAAALPIHLSRRRTDDASEVHHASVVLLYSLAWVGAATLLAYAQPINWPWVGPVYAGVMFIAGRAVASAVASLTDIGPTRDTLALVFIAVFTVVGVVVLQLPVLAMLALAAVAVGMPTGEGHGESFARRAVDLVVPIVGVVIAAQLDLAAHFGAWLLLACLVVACDGKAIGAAVGARLAANRPGGAALRIGAMLSAGGGAALLIAWLLHTHELIDTPLFTAIVLAELIALLLHRPIVAMANTLDDSAAHEVR